MATPSETPANRRILIVDDNAAIHEDFRKVLAGSVDSSAFRDLEASLFDEAPAVSEAAGFELTSAHQGEEAVETARTALDAGRPFSVVFLDIRMPPGIDGVETALRLWEVDPRLQVVICSAYSDYSWEDLRKKLGARQQLLVLKKPFDSVEVLQLAHALTEKWALLLSSQRTMVELEAVVASRTERLQATHEKLVAETARREATEARLRHTQKLEALGRVAGGIVHEIAQPLSFVTNNLTLISRVVDALQSPVPISPDLNQATRDALNGAERIRHIVRDVQTFSHAGAAPLASVPVSAALAQALRMAAPKLEGRSAVLTEGDDDVEVLASEEGLVQVLYNLLANAADATSASQRDAIKVSVRASGADRVTIEVRDRGHGIASEHLPRIFDPFFTTRSVGSGTGLGLCICHGILTRSGGEIAVESSVGVGTTFRVTLARSKATAVPAAA